MKFDRIDWNRACFKTYYEKRSVWHLLVNFNRFFVIHVSLFWFYTAYNSPTIYGREENDNVPSSAMRWSVTALGGAVATLIMLAATLAEFSYIPTSWNNTSHLTRRLLALLVCLAVTAGPTVYIASVDGNNDDSNIPLIVSVVQLALSAVITLAFAIIPSGRMFGDRVTGKSRKYLASQTFTASYPGLEGKARTASFALWIIIFLCKFVESYFFLTLSFRDPIHAMVHMKIQKCHDRILGNALCTNHASFTLALMYVMDLSLFFLDTFLWYVIWNTVFAVARGFSIGLSVWTPWQDLYTRLPKRIYSKILATSDMEVKYKPKVC